MISVHYSCLFLNVFYTLHIYTVLLADPAQIHLRVTLRLVLVVVEGSVELL